MRLTGGRIARTAALLVLGGLGGCERGDPRLENLTVGMPQDSAVAVMGGSPERTEPYLTQGKYIQALFYARPGQTDPASRTPREMVPLVTIDGKLAGWGWDYWDSVAGANDILVPPKDTASPKR